ncbi:hypothetical protein HID58_086026 [Brassica napus]|uniref:Uncharacterized protein n=1 Tax=Brassica napus TaxID=3708 RepID=A0ABQ7XP97_BRANA|nr:hypothetical protein HID58_086026 [Brassica napus]
MLKSKMRLTCSWDTFSHN